MTEQRIAANRQEFLTVCLERDRAQREADDLRVIVAGLKLRCERLTDALTKTEWTAPYGSEAWKIARAALGKESYVV